MAAFRATRIHDLCALAVGDALLLDRRVKDGNAGAMSGRAGSGQPVHQRRPALQSHLHLDAKLLRRAIGWYWRLMLVEERATVRGQAIVCHAATLPSSHIAWIAGTSAPID